RRKKKRMTWVRGTIRPPLPSLNSQSNWVFIKLLEKLNSTSITKL
ncbi:24848_t:CDS:2, partial [Racocetra persica]